MQSIDASDWIAAFARASAFAATVPVAGAGTVPRAVRVVLALSLVPAIVARSHGGASPVIWLDATIVGAAFGVAAAVVAASASAAGALIDSALAMRPFGRDDIFGGAQGPFGRLFSLAFAVAFLSTGAMTRLCERFVEASTSAATPISSHAVGLITVSFRSALDIAAPSIAAQMLVTIATAIVARAAPRINGLMLASPAVTCTVLVTVLLGIAPTLRALIELARRVAMAAPL